MKTDVVIEGLNRSLEALRDYREIRSEGHFVLAREVSIPSTFTKAIKEFTAKFYFVKGKEKYLVIEKSFVGKAISEDQEENCRREVDIMMMQELFFLMSQSVVMDIMVEGKCSELKEIWETV